MMRRARWLAVGAVLGALGYQRLNRATRSQADRFGQMSAARQAAGAVGLAATAAAHTAGHLAGAAGWLARRARDRRAAERRHLGGAGGFIGDVRAGMDDYLDRHQANIERQYRRSGNTLVSQRAPDRAAIPGGPAGAPGSGPAARESLASHSGGRHRRPAATRRQD
jgi:hypothetical protein